MLKENIRNSYLTAFETVKAFVENEENIEKTENLCFLIGSGCSSKAIPLMGKNFNNI